MTSGGKLMKKIMTGQEIIKKRLPYIDIEARIGLSLKKSKPPCKKQSGLVKVNSFRSYGHGPGAGPLRNM